MGTGPDTGAALQVRQVVADSMWERKEEDSLASGFGDQAND